MNSLLNPIVRSLTMRALPPGNYQIMASCTAKDGSWVPAQQLLQLTISPPWYKHGGLY